MNKRISVSLLALLVAQGAAVAADLPFLKAPPAPPPPFSWDGPYIGTHVGYGWNNVQEQGWDYVPGTFTAAGTPLLANPVWYSQKYMSRGPFTGFQIGYNKQFGNFLLGGEFDITWSGQNTNKPVYNSLGSALAFPIGNTLGGPFQTDIQDNWRWSMRVRAGYADGRTLYYATGGMVNGGYSLKHYYWGIPGTTPYTPQTDLASTAAAYFATSNFGNSGSFNIERFGWTAGAGVEYAFNDKWSANLEYRHNDFGTATVTSNLFPGLTFHERSYEDTIRLGINYHTGLPLFVTTLPVEAPAEPPKKETKKAEAAPPAPPPDPSFLGRLYHAYADEWGIASPPTDPNAPPSRRAYFPPAPETQPPYPFTEWHSAARRQSARPCPIRSIRPS